MRTFKSVGSQLSEENDSTGHETMTLRNRKVTAWVAGQLQLLTANCAADNLEEVRDRGREGQASRSLEQSLVQTRYSS
jgi:hypothetical protein